MERQPSISAPNPTPLLETVHPHVQPHLQPNWGQAPNRPPSCVRTTNQRETHVKKSDFPTPSAPWAAAHVLQEQELLCSLPCSPRLIGDLKSLYHSGCPVAASLPSPGYHLPSAMGAVASAGLKYRYSVLNELCVAKQEEAMGRRKRGLFQRNVWLVGLTGGVKLYECEMLLLLFMNYPALCLTLPEISFYWLMQSGAILWLPSLL